MYMVDDYVDVHMHDGYDGIKERGDVVTCSYQIKGILV